jgi:peptidoglycan/LPS O-acetylase OafA/YrhL
MTGAQRFSALDGLRAIAIALVLARHGARPFENDAPAFMLNGWMGVDLFFALSGFLVGWHILNRYGGGAARFHWREYARGRLLRIAPAYLATVALIVVGAFPFYAHSSDDVALSLLRHALFLQDLGGADLAVTLWSLGVEVKFYLAAPILIFLAWRLRSTRARIVALCALALIPLIARTIGYALAPAHTYDAFFAAFRSPFFMSFDGLALGLAGAAALKLCEAHCARYAPFLFWLGAAAFGALLLAPEWLKAITWFDAVALQSLLALASAALVLGAACGAGPRRLLGARFMGMIGARAYCLYLAHFPLIPLAFGVARIVGETHADPVVFAFVYLLASFAVAEAMHRFVERPFLQLKDKDRASVAGGVRAA